MEREKQTRETDKINNIRRERERDNEKRITDNPVTGPVQGTDASTVVIIAYEILASLDRRSRRDGREGARACRR